jgi:4-amino-4-deoxy-L-arabinose transferase-like glycosyltransferase
MASYGLFGVSMWSARLMMLAVTCITLLITYRCALFLFGNRPKAVLATCILSACYLCVGFARIAMTEPLLALFSLAALYSYLLTAKGKRPLLSACSGALFTGLAFMSKGPAGLLPLAAVAACILTSRGREKGTILRVMFNPLAVIIFALVTVPWYVYIQSVYPGELTGSLSREAGTLFKTFHPVRIVTRIGFYSGALAAVHLPFSATAVYLYIKNRTRSLSDLSLPLWFCGIFLFIFVFFIDIHKERYLTGIAPAVSIIIADIIYSEKWKKWVATACIVSLFQIFLYNTYPLFSHEALRALVASWEEHHTGTLGLPLDRKRAGWCRLYAHDRNIAHVDSADYLIIADKGSESYGNWKTVQTETRLSSLDFRNGKPVLHHRIFHLIQRQEEP